MRLYLILLLLVYTSIANAQRLRDGFSETVKLLEHRKQNPVIITTETGLLVVTDYHEVLDSVYWIYSFPDEVSKCNMVAEVRMDSDLTVVDIEGSDKLVMIHILDFVFWGTGYPIPLMVIWNNKFYDHTNIQEYETIQR